MDDSSRDRTDRTAEPGAPTRDGFEAVATAALEAVFADRQRALVSGMLDASEAVGAARDSLSRAKRDEAAKAAETAAQWLQDYANDMARSGPNRLLATAEDMARRNPALFVGGAAAIGAAVMWRLQSGQSLVPFAARSGEGEKAQATGGPSGEVKTTDPSGNSGSKAA
ncbi:hypothetical protein KAJ83_08535 [Marivibrio halodurans]|uniref:Uncharacterized protein n=1 Tax=Marivibrio halodurans TaxID=2039722 RepID=A0A8J7S1V5_9PROT|nr:hypothetical protein [Marivibrio halodurans]MBP5857053.1 hypothetical protein [Marivibrio halodurans]